MAKKSRSLKRHIMETFRRCPSSERLNNFDHSIAYSHVSSTPVLVYDMMKMVAMVSQVYHVFRLGDKDSAPQFSSRQKQVIALCLYVEEQGELCDLKRGEDGKPVAEFLDADAKTSYVHALCVLNDLERRQADEPVQEFVSGGSDWVQAQTVAIEKAVDLDGGSDDLTD